MLNVAICDDKIGICHQIKNHMMKFAKANSISINCYIYNDPKELLQSNRRYNLYLLEVMMPLIFLFILYVGNISLLNDNILKIENTNFFVFHFLLTFSILVLFIIIINNIYSLILVNEQKAHLVLARNLIELEKNHYNKNLEYNKKIRILKHDFRHHIHALLNMSKEEQITYLNDLEHQLESFTEKKYCNNYSLNSLLSEFEGKCRETNINFSTHIVFPEMLCIDDLSLCIVIGNLLTNAYEATIKVKNRFISVNAKHIDDHIMLMVENSFTGYIKKHNSIIVSSKKNGGLGHISIKRILDNPEDEFTIDYTKDRFIAMVKIKDRI